jgi:hypothetical protein
VAKHLTEHPFRSAVLAVDVCRIEKRYSQVEGLVHHRTSGFKVDSPTEIVAAQTHLGDPKAALSEIAMLHPDIVVGRAMAKERILIQ